MPSTFARTPLRNALALGVALCVLLALWIPNLLGVDALTSEAGTARKLEAAALGAVFWLLCCAVLGRLWLVLFLTLPVTLVWPLELWLRWHHGTPISSHLVALAFESNWAESANFFSAYGVGLSLLTLIWIPLYAAGCWWAWRLDVRWHYRSRIYLVAIFVPLLVLLYSSQSANDALGRDFKVAPLDDPNISSWAVQWVDVYPINIPLAIVHFRRQQGKLHALQAGLTGRSLQAQQVSTDAPEVVVLVIGESASAMRWGLLGYHRDTTPRLSQQSGLVAFGDVVALSAATRTAVPGVLSRRPVLSPEGNIDLQAEPSLIKAFAEVGYQTHWLSNQSPMGQHDTPISLYAREAADVRFLNPATYQHRSHLDEVLLPPLRDVLAQPGRHLVVLHLLGSHFDYSLRYPTGFDYFQPSLQSGPPASPESAQYAEQVSNSYDNSLRYTDHVLAEVLDTVRQRGGNGVVAYFSDHGVDPAQGACASKTPNRRSEATYRVPAFVWLSESMQTRHARLWQGLQDNARQPYTTRAVYATVLELAQIDIAGGLPPENFLHSTPPQTPARMVAGISSELVNFDAARAANACFIVGP